ncbi:MAG: hypothetical protein HXX19_17700 [Rhodoferax sp.]|nr:hypothetical protein [Rhodoferax sp.]
MPLHHAIVFVDHHCARIVQFGSEQAHERKVNAHLHLNGQDERNQRSQHEFFAKVCDGLDGVAEVLVVGGHSGITDFRHYAQKHRPGTAAHIAGYAPVDHPSDNELVALGRQWFTHQAQRAGLPA